MSSLESQVLRIASNLPEGDPARKELLAALKEASDHNLFWEVVDNKAFLNLRSRMKSSGDEQSVALLREIHTHLSKALTLDSRNADGFTRLRNMLPHAAQWDEALLRNNIFKIANSLGIKLPSGMF